MRAFSGAVTACLGGKSMLGLLLNPVLCLASFCYLSVLLMQDTTSLCPKPSYSTVCYTQKGLAYYSDWGTTRNTANMMFIAALMGKYSDAKQQQHICWARMQMRYITGSLANAGE